MQALWYRMIDDSLYRKNFYGTLLRYVPLEESQIILHEFHYGFFERYYSGPITIDNILQVGYY